MQLLKSILVIIIKQLDMKPDKRSKYILGFVVACSLLSSFYLRAQYSDYSQSSEQEIMAVCLKEGTILPDVHLVKELLRSIFNVVNTNF